MSLASEQSEPDVPDTPKKFKRTFCSGPGNLYLIWVVGWGVRVVEPGTELRKRADRASQALERPNDNFNHTFCCLRSRKRNGIASRQEGREDGSEEGGHDEAEEDERGYLGRMRAANGRTAPGIERAAAAAGAMDPAAAAAIAAAARTELRRKNRRERAGF